MNTRHIEERENKEKEKEGEEEENIVCVAVNALDDTTGTLDYNALTCN